MKSRSIIWLAVLLAIPSVEASAQVTPIGKSPNFGRVQPASCQSCSQGGSYEQVVDGYSGGYDGACQGGCSGASHGGFYGVTVWGTECLDCTYKPGLFPPCPNPCQTTLLGELCHDVKTVVDGTLSHVFGCVFGHPCGCRGVCTCTDFASCSSCGSSDCGCESGMLPTMTIVPSDMSEGNPFRDDPSPTPALQPVPNASARRSMLPQPGTSVRRFQPSPQRVNRVSYEVPVPARPSDLSLPTTNASRANPVPPTTQVPHYHPQHRVALRRANGATVRSVADTDSGSRPPLRFRSGQ